MHLVGAQKAAPQEPIGAESWRQSYLRPYADCVRPP